MSDNRGFFKYIFQENTLKLNSGTSFTLSIKQGNHSFSRPRVLRGIHLEPWNKLIYVVSGKATIVVVNLMKNHSEFGMHMKLKVGDFSGGRKAVYIPQGFGNAFFTEAPTHYLNFVSEEFSPLNRQGVFYNDPALQIDWGFKVDPILSKQDSLLPLLRELIN